MNHAPLRLLAIACCALLGATILVAPARADSASASGIVLLPAQITLRGPEARQRLVVEKLREGQMIGEAGPTVRLSSSDEKIVKIEAGCAVPVGDGKATITAEFEGQKAAAEVTVIDLQKPFAWSFRNDVESVLSKAGCNSGACHGAQAGKNGFKLTLFGYDPAADYRAIARQDRGRRISASDPGRSLVLTKPTAAIPHKGGVRLEVGSHDYRVLSEWIATGCPPPKDDDPRIERVEVLPLAVRLAPAATQQLLVRAWFSDRQARDVTHWAKYTSADETVATVDGQGKVTVRGSGEGAISAWFLNQLVMARVTVPFGNQVPAETFAQTPSNNLIDRHVLGKLSSLGLPPSQPASDAEFLRRAFIDTIGALPTPDETRSFLADPSPEKRTRLIDQLLARPEFVDYWTYKWSDLLLVNSTRLRPAAMKAYARWIRRHVAANTPWDVMVHELVVSQGSTLENGAANFYALHQDPTDMAETTSMAFLGMSINCAKCHNHPLEKWTNDQYYGMANLFARVRAKDAAGEGNLIVFSATQGDLIQPTTGAVQPPRPLDAPAISPDAGDDRRHVLARWLTAPENPYFTRAIVNRVWANFFSAGLVEKVDDLRLTNPASNEDLLAGLANELVKNKYDLRWLMRTILQSAAYQRSSRALPENKGDTRYYSRYYPRRLTAEVLLDALSRATGAPTEFAGYPKGTRALELPDVNVASYFLKSFGRPERTITCECERTSEPTMVQVLHIANGDTVNQKLAAKGNRIDALLAANAPDLAILDEVYLSALCRFPTESEKVRTLFILGATPQNERRQALEDIGWSVLSSKEFLFNH